jgi:hypothetical protein
MTAGGFHVHGPHDHELEHAAAHAGPKDFAGRLAVVTAVIATVGALFAYMGGLTQANAGLFKNDGAIKKTEASNQWNYYQAKSSKQNLAELALELAPESRRAFYADEIKRYKSEKDVIKRDAEKLEKASDEWNQRSDEQIHQHHRWAQATTALADRDRDGGDRAADEEPLAAVRGIRHQCARQRPSASSPSCTSEQPRRTHSIDGNADEGRHLERQLARDPPAAADHVARDAPARRDVPAGDEARGREVSARRDRRRRLPLGVLRAEDLQRRRAAEPHAGCPTSSATFPASTIRRRA